MPPLRRSPRHALRLILVYLLLVLVQQHDRLLLEFQLYFPSIVFAPLLPVVLPVINQLVTDYCLLRRGPFRESLNYTFDTYPAHLARDTCRFTKDQIDILVRSLHMPTQRILRSVVSPHDCLLVTLYRLALGPNYREMSHHFKWSPSMISRMVSRTIYWLDEHFGWLLREHNILLEPEWLMSSAEFIQQHSQLREPCVSLFVDGKLFTVCRPSQFQRAIFNGKDHRHGLKFQVCKLSLVIVYSSLSGCCQCRWPLRQLRWSTIGENARCRTVSSFRFRKALQR